MKTLTNFIRHEKIAITRDNNTSVKAKYTCDYFGKHTTHTYN